MAMLRACGGNVSTGSPSKATLPDEIGSRPAITRNRVDLPQPDGPTSARNSPSAIDRLISLRTCRPAKSLLRPVSSIRAILIVLYFTLPAVNPPISRSWNSKAIT